MLRQLLDNTELLTGAYRTLVDANRRGDVVDADELTAEYQHLWLGLRDRRLINLAEYYAARFFELLSQIETLEAILDRLQYVDQDYEKMIATAECPEDDSATALTSAMALLVMLFRRLEDRGHVQLLENEAVAAWLTQHAAALGGKHGQLTLL